MASMGSARILARSSVSVLRLLACFCGTPNSGSGSISDFLTPLGGLAQPRYDGMCLILLYLVWSCLAVNFGGFSEKETGGK